MSGLIRRQDAIDAVTRAIWHYPNESYKNLNVYEVTEALVSDAINSLPSAEPTGDLISRQAAIDVLEERLRANGYSNVALVSELNRSVGYLMRLPSAEQRTETVLCALADRACPFQGKEFAWCLTCPHISEKDRELVKKAVAKQKTGEWKVKREHNRWMRKCSVCGWMQEIDTPKMQGWYYSYCPNCGADMRGEEER